MPEALTWTQNFVNTEEQYASRSLCHVAEWFLTSVRSILISSREPFMCNAGKVAGSPGQAGKEGANTYGVRRRLTSISISTSALVLRSFPPSRPSSSAEDTAVLDVTAEKRSKMAHDERGG